jgi:ABC-type cobalamin/Fe3+-siderophores transport system ATPase subunit
MLERYADQVVLVDHTAVKMGPPEEILSSQEFRNVFRMGGV